MSEVIGAVIGALAVVGIPIIAWYSRRATREGRLVLRVERLGGVYALMPDSAEKDAFKPHLTTAISYLNAWLDEDNVKRRRLIRTISGITYVGGLVAGLALVPLIEGVANPWFTAAIGVVLGLAITAITTGSRYLIERHARRKAEKVATDREGAVTAERVEALKRGEPLPGSQSEARTYS